jgi:hypothetical protein
MDGKATPATAGVPGFMRGWLQASQHSMKQYPLDGDSAGHPGWWFGLAILEQRDQSQAPLI